MTPPDLARARSATVEDPAYPDKGSPEVDALHYDLALDWDGSRLQGTATIRLRVTRDTPTLTLDLDHRLAASSVTLDGAPVRADQQGDHLVVTAPRLRAGATRTLVVRYDGTPGPVDAPTTRPDDDGGLGWAYDSDGNVSTYQEPYGAFTWYPVNDQPSDKAFYDVTVTAPPGQLGVSNGRLVGRRDDAGRTTTSWHLDSPASSYLTTLAIGRYRQHTQTLPGGIPASVWTLPQDDDRAERLQGALREAYAWLTPRAGSYPFSTVGMVVTEGQSAMETQTLMTMGRGPVTLQPAEVTVHELAHQWYGDAVTTRDWRDTWLNEGWAMYWELVYRDSHDSGRMTPEQQRAGCAASVRDDGQPASPRTGHFAGENIYLCPALMLAQVRATVGDDRFARLATGWPARYRGQAVGRADFERFAQEVTGVDIRPITHRWLDAVDPAALSPAR